MNHPAVITATALFDRLSARAHRDFVLIDCRFALANPDLGRQQYETAHIPGAYYLDLNQDLSGPVAEHGGRHPLPDERVLGAKLAALGISDRTLVVVYDDSRLGFAARLWWLLRYYGHERVAVLDGGYSNWLKAGYPITPKQIPAPEPGNFQPHLRSDWIVDIDGVKAIQTSPTHVLIDSREADRYLGNTEPIDRRAGHIPGAVNYPWQTVSKFDGTIAPIAAQQQRWAELTGRSPIVYCGSGVTACVNLFSLHLAGIEGAKLYPGSWSDWISYD